MLVRCLICCTVSGQKKDNDWGSGGGSNWGDPRGDPRGGGMDPRGPMDSRDMRGQDPRDLRGKK